MSNPKQAKDLIPDALEEIKRRAKEYKERNKCN